MLTSFRAAIPAFMQPAAANVRPPADPGMQAAQAASAAAQPGLRPSAPAPIHHALFSPKSNAAAQLGEPKVFVDEPNRIVRLIYGEPFDTLKPSGKEQKTASWDYFASCKEYPIAFEKGLYDLESGILGTLGTVQLRAFASELDQELDSLVERFAFHGAEDKLLAHISAARSILYIVKMHSRVRGGAGGVFARDILDFARRHGFDLITVSTISDAAAKTLQRADFVERLPVAYWEKTSKQRAWIYDMISRDVEGERRKPGIEVIHFGSLRGQLALKAEVFDHLSMEEERYREASQVLRRLLYVAHDEDHVVHVKTPGFFCLTDDMPKEIDGRRIAAYTMYTYGDFPQRALSSAPWVTLNTGSDLDFYLHPVL